MSAVDPVRVMRGVVYDIGQDELRRQLLLRLDRTYSAVRAGVGLCRIADDLRRAADVAESDGVAAFEAWLAQVEADARRAVKERAA